MKLNEIAKKAIDEQSAQMLRHREGVEYDCKPLFTGNKKHWAMLDTFTASAIVQIYDNISPDNKVKYISLPLPKFINLTWKIANKAS